MDNGKENNRIKRRIGIMLLALLVSVSMMPAFAFADDTSDPADNPEKTKIESAEIEEPVLIEDSTSAEEVPVLDKETQQVSESKMQEEPAPADEESAPGEDESEPEMDFEAVTNEDDLPDSEELLQQYLDSKIEAETGSVLKSNASSGSDNAPKTKLRAKRSLRRDSLSAKEKTAYDQISPYIKKIASGEMDKAAFSVDHSADVSFPRVISALMLDMPYEFYWYDKVEGYLHGAPDGVNHLFYLSVSKDYWNPSFAYYYSRGKIVYGLDTAKTASTSSAIANVSSILNYFSGESDIDKLESYRDIICALVCYDEEAAATANAYASHLSTKPFYGDPWQLISVFDGDSTTNVVCEGYSKAFQYLCDLSDFNSNIECYTVQGDMFSPSLSGGAGHMWNVLHMDDGANYIADITNCDAGYTDMVFLKGWTGNDSTIATGYTFGGESPFESTWIKYVYDAFAKGMFTETELTLSNTAYGTAATVIHCAAKAPTCTAAGNTERWLKQGYYYKTADCSQRLSYTATEIKPLGHDWNAGTVTRAATEDTAGNKRFVCKRCGAARDEGIPMLAHTHRYTATDTLDYVLYKCACGYSYKKSKVVVDLPGVSIKKPAKAKAGFTAKWKKLKTKKRKKITGYEIQYSTRKDFADAVSVVKTASKSKTSKKFKKLAKKKTYYVRVRTYKWISGVKHVSKWSSVKKVKTK